VEALPFDDDQFDWAWSVDCVGYGPGDSPGQVAELVRVVRPGGKVALAIYSSQQLLPGYPLLEARLNATTAGIAPFSTGSPPETHYLRAAGVMRSAGLKGVEVSTFVAGFHAPLPDDIRTALTLLIGMRWDEAGLELEPEDRDVFRRVCRPGSTEFILDLPDYYGFLTYSVFSGLVGRRLHPV
jgi:demethylmenaquinone methyltransferase/2-methoxy-6-polyprenyl-1,4-benzoquinol methylase